MSSETPDGGASCPWGRVAADGTVYVRTEAGERVVGSWQAGPAAEGLAHYRRRFEDLATEADLLDRRIESGAADPKSTLSAASRLRESLASAAAVGDLESVARRLDGVRTKAQQRLDAARVARAAEAERALARKTALVEEAEALADAGTAWKTGGERLREIAAGWNADRGTSRGGSGGSSGGSSRGGSRGVDGRADAELWKRLTAARSTFNRRRGVHFARLDQQRKEAEVGKEELIAAAEALAASTEWGPTARRFKDLMAQWKAAPRAGRDAEEALWQRFRAAQDGFFQRRAEVFAERDAAGRENLAAKERIVAEVEALDLRDPQAARDRLRRLQEHYEGAKPVPREAIAGLDLRMRAAEQRVQAAADGQRRRTTAPANPLIDQMREQVGKAEGQVLRARAAGDDRALQAAEESLARRREFLGQAERSLR